MMTASINDEKNRKSCKKIGRIYNALLDKSQKRKGHIIFLEKLLQTEGDINYKISEDGAPNLISVVLYQNREQIKLLLDHGVDFTYKDDRDRTAIHVAVEDKLLRDSWVRHEYIDAILAAQVKSNNPWNPSDNNGITHFHAACMTNNIQAVEFFLNNGVDVNHAVKMNSPYTAGYTALHFAVKYQYVDVVKILLKHGANIYAKNAIGLSPLHNIARIESERENVDEILQIFANHVIKTNDIGELDSGFSHLHVVCYLHNELLIHIVLTKCSEDLVNRAVSFDSPVCPGFTPLHFAVFCNFRVFQLLLQKGANILAKNARDVTAFDLLCLRSKHELRQILFAISTIDEWQSTVLSDHQTKLVDVVSAMESKDLFVSLLNDANIANSSVFVPLDSTLWPGYTVLHIAVMLARKVDVRLFESVEKEHDSKMVKKCLKLGADVTIKDAEGSTPIHLAFHAQKYDIVQLLFDHHYERTENPVDKNNLSHFHIACALGCEKIVQHFLSNGVDVNNSGPTTFTLMKNYLNPANSSALHFSVVAGECSRGIIEKLLVNGADVNAKDANGFTPVHRLMFATSLINAGTCDKLLSDERLENSTTLYGNLTHLHVACYYGHVSSIKKLLKNGADANATVTFQSLYPFDNNFSTYHYGFSAPREDNDLSLSLFLRKCMIGSTPLDLLLRKHGRIEQQIIFMLIEHNVDISARREKGTSPLERLLNEQDYLDDCYKTFSENATVKARLVKELGITELHIACCIADCQLVEKLIGNGINVNSRVNSDSPIWRGYTPLHCVVQRIIEKLDDKKITDCGFISRLIEIVRLLTKHGADLLLTHEEGGNTPFHLIINPESNAAKLRKISVVVSSVFKNLSDFSANPMNLQGISLFHIACAIQNEAAIEKFLKQGNVDVNQAISFFSEICPGSTALHLLIKYYPSRDDLRADEALLRIVDMLLDNHANVNAQDAFGNTPLFEAVVLSGSIRRVLIQKLISRGADVRAANVKGITPFELLLTKSDKARWEGIEVFLKAGCHFNTYNSITGEGYLAKVFRSDTNILKNQRFLKIISNPDMIHTNGDGRSAIHNLVSIDCDKKFFEYDRLDSSTRTTIIEAYYTQLIEFLSMRGCDIDQQDNAGETALHLAVRLNNVSGIVGLLNNGADVNLTNNNGKTVFAYFSCSCGACYRHAAALVLSRHVYKLEFCGQRVSEQIKSVKAAREEYFMIEYQPNPFADFHKEIDKSMNMKIGSTSQLSVYEFLMSTDIDTIYKKMTLTERREMDQFLENIGDYQFLQIGCILKLKYRSVIERISLLEPALASFNILIKWKLADLCCRNIISHLKNAELKRLIASQP